VRIVIDHASVPLLDGAREALIAGHSTGGGKRNAAWIDDDTDWNDAGDDVRALFTDPQTSGGLLVAIPPQRAAAFLTRVPAAVIVGRVEEAGTGARLAVV
jgi:selenide,water dikinase